MQKIKPENKHHLNFVSKEVMYSDISDGAFRTWNLIRLQYKAQQAINKDWLKCYTCSRDWIAEQRGMSSRTITRQLVELEEAGLLYRIKQHEAVWFFVVLDPADYVYETMVDAINAYERNKEIRFDAWLKKNKPEQHAIVYKAEATIPPPEESKPTEVEVITEVEEKPVEPITEALIVTDWITSTSSRGDTYKSSYSTKQVEFISGDEGRFDNWCSYNFPNYTKSGGDKFVQQLDTDGTLSI